MVLKPVVLELDEPATNIGEFFDQLIPGGVERRQPSTKGTALGGRKGHIDPKSSSQEVRDMILDTVPQGSNLVMYGHGRYHHFTYGLCTEIADRQSDEYVYIHIDKHHDSYLEHDGYFDCGSFVRNILQDSNAKKVRYIGSKLPYELNATLEWTPIPEDTIRCMWGTDLDRENYQKALVDLLSGTPEDAYVTIDLDVMLAESVTTGTGEEWGNGTLDLETLEKMLDYIMARKRIIGCDIIGFSGDEDDAKSMGVYRALAGKLMGKPLTEARMASGVLCARQIISTTRP